MVIEQLLKENGVLVTYMKGELKPDSFKRDNEKISLSEDINEYFRGEVEPYLENVWMDRTKDKISYEINFRKYFFSPKKLRDPDLILRKIHNLYQDIYKLQSDL